MSRWISGHWSDFQGSYSSLPTWGGVSFFPNRWTALFANCSAPPLLSLYHGTCALVLNLGSGPFCFQSDPYEKCKGWTGRSFTLSSHSIMESKRVKVSKSYLCVLWQFRKKEREEKSWERLQLMNRQVRVEGAPRAGRLLARSRTLPLSQSHSSESSRLAPRPKKRSNILSTSKTHCLSSWGGIEPLWYSV